MTMKCVNSESVLDILQLPQFPKPSNSAVFIVSFKRCCNFFKFSYSFLLLLFTEDEDLDWPLACIQREEFHNLWTNTETVEHFTLTEAHYAAVDCVHLTEVRTNCNQSCGEIQ